jgi:large repetitive protein
VSVSRSRRRGVTAAPASAVVVAAGSTLLLGCLAGCGPAPIDAVAIDRRNLAGGLVAHWAFDDQSGTTVADGSNNGHHGQLTGGAWVAGRFGGGLRLEFGDSVTFPNFPQATPDWTVSVWINLTAADRAALISSDRAVLLTAERSLVGGWEIEFDPRPGFEWLEASYLVGPPVNDYVILDCKCIDIDRWMQFTAVFDTTNNRFSLYRDGVLVDGSSLPAPIAPGDTNLGIGRWYQGPRSISGVIDDYAIWSRALSGDEVAALQARAVPDSL